MSFHFPSLLLSLPLFLFFPVEQLVRCPMCSRTLDNPRTLPCLHTFCLGCLDHQQATTPAPLRCRQCNSLFTAPAFGGFASLECSSFIDSLLKSLKGTGGDVNAVIMCVCNTEEATMHCVNCNVNLGPSCSAGRGCCRSDTAAGRPRC